MIWSRLLCTTHNDLLWLYFSRFGIQSLNKFVEFSFYSRSHLPSTSKMLGRETLQRWRPKSEPNMQTRDSDPLPFSFLQLAQLVVSDGGVQIHCVPCGRGQAHQPCPGTQEIDIPPFHVCHEAGRFRSQTGCGLQTNKLLDRFGGNFPLFPFTSQTGCVLQTTCKLIEFLVMVTTLIDVEINWNIFVDLRLKSWERPSK